MLFFPLISFNSILIFFNLLYGYKLGFVLEYLNRVFIIGVFLPMYQFRYRKKFTMVHSLYWFVALLGGFSNPIDFIFYKSFGFTPMMAILLVNLFIYSTLLYFYINFKSNQEQFQEETLEQDKIYSKPIGSSSPIQNN